MSRSCQSVMSSIDASALPRTRRHAGDALAGNRVALVGHRRRTLLAGTEIFLGFADVGALKIANLCREFLEGTGDDGQRRHIFGMPVALDDLRRELRGRQPEFFADHRLNARVDVRVGAHGAGKLAHRYDFLCVLNALDIAVHLVHP